MLVIGDNSYAKIEEFGNTYTLCLWVLTKSGNVARISQLRYYAYKQSAIRYALKNVK